MGHYKDLIVWQKGMRLAVAVYRLSADFPKSEQYGLTSQLRRSAISILSNTAEGNGRGSRSDYLHFLHIARGSCFELDTQLLLCQEIDLCGEKQLEPLFLLVKEIGQLLNALIRKLSTPSNI